MPPPPRPEALPTAVAIGPRREAAGPPAVVRALRRSFAEMGVTKSVRTLSRLNQSDGFDCPGCAWPDPAPGDRKHAEFCENGAKAVADEATERRVAAEFFAAHSVADLAGRSDYWLGEQGRLTSPLVQARDRGPLRTRQLAGGASSSWPASCGRSRTPTRAVFYTSGRASNEAAFVFQLFARAYGTNNLPDCSNMCHESSGAALGGDHRHRQGRASRSRTSSTPS